VELARGNGKGWPDPERRPLSVLRLHFAEYGTNAPDRRRYIPNLHSSELLILNAKACGMYDFSGEFAFKRTSVYLAKKLGRFRCIFDCMWYSPMMGISIWP